MKNTPVYIVAFIVWICAVIGMADTKDAWRLKMNLKNGDTKTLLLEGVDSIVLGDTIKPEVKPGDVDANGEPVLMDVSYKHYYEWEWYHHNLENCTYPVVERTRTFSDGTVLTDEFRDYGHPCDIGGCIAVHNDSDGRMIYARYRKIDEYFMPFSEKMAARDYTRWEYDDWKEHETEDGRISGAGERFILHEGDVKITRTDDELSFTMTHCIGVDYLNDIDSIYFYDGGEDKYGIWNKYIASKIYADIDSDGDAMTYPSCMQGLPMGWYFQSTLKWPQFWVYRKNSIAPILDGYIDFNDYDQYFIDENRMVDFLDMRSKVETYGPLLEKATCSWGDCIIFRFDVKTEKCGIKQDFSISDTIYEIKYDKPVLRYLTPLTMSNGNSSNGHDYFRFEGGVNKYTLISSLQPDIRISGDGYSAEFTDLGEATGYTNRSLPFHNWEIIIRSDENLTDVCREGVISLLDSNGASVQTINLYTEKKPDDWYEEE